MTKKFVCQVDGRKFNSAQALKQHQAAHGQNTAHVPKPPRRRRNRRGGRKLGRLSSVTNNMVMATLENSGFLKCGLAQVDKQATGFIGIPDEFNGKVFSLHNDMIEVETVAAGTTLYIIKAPSPGIAYYKSTTLTGEFTPVYFPETDQLFPDNVTAQVSQFRFAAASLEITNNTPTLNIGGNVVVANAPLKMATYNQQGDSKLAFDIMGMPDKITQHVYADNAKNGCFTVAVNQERIFNWADVHTGPQTNGYSIPLGPHGAALVNHDLHNGYVHRGWDNGMGSKIVAITAPAGNAQTIFVRSLACVEYRPEPDSLLADVATDSPPHNKFEMELYHKLARELPIAVPRADNGSFWNFIKGAARGISKVLSHVPGPIGMISGGVNQLIS